MSGGWLHGVLVATAALLLSGCQSSFFAAVNGIRSDRGTERMRAEVFDTGADLRLDIYRPSEHATNAPVVIFYYGGSWRSGARAWYEFVGRALAAEGSIVVIPDYRKFPEVSFKQLMADAANAVAWVEGHRQLLGSTGPLYLAGHSAGAHVAALLTTDQRYLRQAGVRPASVSGLIGFAGPYNFLPIVDPKVVDVFVDTAGAFDAQPINHVDKLSAPALLIHGSDDSTVLPSNSASFAAALRQVGVAAQYHQIPDMGHAELIFEVGRDTKAGADIGRYVREFLSAGATRNQAPDANLPSGPG